MAEHTKEEFARIFGKNVRGRRRQKHWSQPQLAELAGIYLKTLQNYEGGHQLARMDIAWELARALRVPLAKLLPWPGDDVANS